MNPKTEQIKQVHRNPEENDSQTTQINTDGVIPNTANTDDIQITEKNKIKCTLRKHMLFFDDSNTLKIPLRLFHQLCQDKIYGAPEQATRNLRNSTWQFLIIVLFLAFVMHVIIMFGKFYEMSSISSTIATVAGGMLPLLLKSIHTAKFGMINLKAVNFLRGHIQSIIDQYEHKWPIVDIMIDGKSATLQENSNMVIEVFIPKKKSSEDDGRKTNKRDQTPNSVCCAGSCVSKSRTKRRLLIANTNKQEKENIEEEKETNLLSPKPS